MNENFPDRKSIPKIRQEKSDQVHQQWPNQSHNGRTPNSNCLALVNPEPDYDISNSQIGWLPNSQIQRPSTNYLAPLPPQQFSPSVIYSEYGQPKPVLPPVNKHATSNKRGCSRAIVILVVINILIILAAIGTTLGIILTKSKFNNYSYNFLTKYLIDGIITPIKKN